MSVSMLRECFLVTAFKSTFSMSMKLAASWQLPIQKAWIANRPLASNSHSKDNSKTPLTKFLYFFWFFSPQRYVESCDCNSEKRVVVTVKQLGTAAGLGAGTSTVLVTATTVLLWLKLKKKSHKPNQTEKSKAPIFGSAEVYPDKPGP